MYGAALHGLGGALLEEYRWDEDGQFLTGSFADYRCLTAAEAPRIAIAHIETPSPFTPVGAKGCGESSSESAPGRGRERGRRRAAAARAEAVAPAADARPGCWELPAVKPAPFEYHRPGDARRGARAARGATRTRSRSPAARASCRCSTSASPGPRRWSTSAAIAGLAGDPRRGRHARRRRDDAAVGSRALADASALPLLREALALRRPHGDRCRGTVGGSLVHADPTAELPVCALALGARARRPPERAAHDRRPRSSSSRSSRPRSSPASCWSRSRFPAPAGRRPRSSSYAHRHGDFAVVVRRPSPADRDRRRRRRRDARALGRRRARPDRRPVRARRRTSARSPRR